MCSDVPQEQKELVPDLLGQQEARPIVVNVSLLEGNN